MLGSKIDKLENKIDKTISDFNSRFVMSSINQNGGTLDKQAFWKLKKLLAPKNISVPHSIIDSFGNEITDQANIRNEHKNEFTHRLCTRVMDDQLKVHENMQNQLCKLRLLKSRTRASPDFTVEEVDQAIRELKNGKSVDPTGLVRELFKKSGKGLRHSIQMMMNTIKTTHVLPLQWSQMCIRTVKKKKGSLNKFESYRGIFLVPILSLILEKLLKNRMQPTLENNMSTFQTGGAKRNGVIDNLFILRGLIDHTNYLRKELWIIFYDIEKCFDSLWLEDCVNALWRNGIQDDTLYLVYLMNRKAHVTVWTPFGNSDPFITIDLVKQGTCLGPILSNCSLSDICTEGNNFNYGSVQIKPLEFVDDISGDLRQGSSNNSVTNSFPGFSYIFQRET